MPRIAITLHRKYRHRGAKECSGWKNSFIPGFMLLDLVAGPLGTTSDSDRLLSDDIMGQGGSAAV